MGNIYYYYYGGAAHRRRVRDAEEKETETSGSLDERRSALNTMNAFEKERMSRDAESSQSGSSTRQDLNES